MLYIIELIGTLVVGAILGRLFVKIKPAVKVNRYFTSTTIWVLLFIMGMKLSLNRGDFAEKPALFLVAFLSGPMLAAIYFGIFLLVTLAGKKRNARRELRISAPAEQKPADMEKKKEGSEFIAVGINLAVVVAGAGAFFLFPAGFIPSAFLTDAGSWVLLALLLGIGFDLGSHAGSFGGARMTPALLLIPFANIALTALSALIFSLAFHLGAKDSLLMHGGLGWYTLSSAIIAQQNLVALSIYAFIHNLSRELVAVLTAPVAAKVNPYLPIYLGGATSMDVMLPFVQRYSGRIYTLVSFYSGGVCSLAVPFIVKALLGA